MNYQEIVTRFIEERPVLQEHNADLANMGILLRAEFNELMDALEGGDPAEIGFEMADVFFFLLSMCHYLNLDFDMIFKIKVARNLMKRPSSMFQEGDYHEIDAEVRRSWAERGGDEEFLSAISLLGFNVEDAHGNKEGTNRG